jgi:hypothetical protein
MFNKPKDSSKDRKAYLIEQDDLFADVEEKRGSTLFLGKYTMLEAGRVMQKRSFVKDAQKRDLWPIKVVVDSREFPPLQRLQFFHQSASPENMVVDIKLREGRYIPQSELPFEFSFSNYKFLVLEWLTLQNPKAKFSKDRIPLPGQVYPGLGLGRKFFDLFEYLARLNRNDGILAYPAYFHNAVKFLRDFYFLNPEKRGEVQAIREAFPDIPFIKLTWVVNLGCLRDQNDVVYEWKAEEMISPVNRELHTFFKSKQYWDLVEKTQAGKKYTIDWDLFKEKIQERGIVL